MKSIYKQTLLAPVFDGKKNTSALSDIHQEKFNV